ncbi:hypothetical protein [Enterococcus plantarum]|uniref:hypothetical protein n=1 Tax=Enterococcus plantarum TaxID=1077675 RepID=UPI001F5F4D81|nr:hypothetical protein [Enterococcus plantarum]
MKARNEEGKIIYGYIYGKRYAHVKEKLAELKVRYSFTHNNVNLCKGTVQDWLNHWLNVLMRKKKSSDQHIQVTVYGWINTLFLF